MRSSDDDVFLWRGYGDLMTGLMMVFVLIMVISLYHLRLKHQQLDASQEQLRSQQELVDQQTAELARRAAEISRERSERAIRDKEVLGMLDHFSVMLGLKENLAAATQAALGPDYEVDPVTAQLRITEQMLNYERLGQVELSEDARARLDSFGPAYICGLWAFEYQRCLETADADACTRLDPLSALAVKRIHVTGNADLESRNMAVNLATSAERAARVELALANSLRACATQEGDCYTAEQLPELCRDHPDLVWNYAQERLYAVGAGHIAHCNLMSDPLQGRCEDASTLITDDSLRQSSLHRNVTFEIELTNSDLTALIVDVTELEQIMGTDPSLLDSIGTIARRCWTDAPGQGPHLYAACQSIAQACRRTESGSSAWGQYDCDRYQTYCAEHAESAVCKVEP